MQKTGAVTKLVFRLLQPHFIQS